MFTHVDKKDNPTMVDVSEKIISSRIACAHSQIQLPSVFRNLVTNNELILKKGPVIQTAIIAGTMAVKRTHELIPFCHQIPIESCKFDIEVSNELLVSIKCSVKTNYKTGVEMEALTGASVAALTIYDMCKAISHEIVIGETKLLMKSGGKSDYLNAPLYGLVLTGGKSERMESDKALINYKGKPHAEYIFDILSTFCEKTFISSRENQWNNSELSKLDQIIDRYENAGPIGGILSAFEKEPNANWIVVACDLPHFNTDVVKTLIKHKNSDYDAVCFKNKEKGFPEALCALYTPSAYPVIKEAFSKKILCAVKILKAANCYLLEQNHPINLDNINTKDEYNRVMHEIR